MNKGGKQCTQCAKHTFKNSLGGLRLYCTAHNEIVQSGRAVDCEFFEWRTKPITTFDEYQKAAAVTAAWDKAQDPSMYCIMGLVGEAGEIANKVKKTTKPGMRGDVFFDDIRNELLDECGDVLWYLSMLAKSLNSSLEDVANRNIEKLASRQQRGVIKGNGDQR